MNDEDIGRAIDECTDALTASNCPFSQWEQEFLESVKERWELYSSISFKQKEVLSKIWEKI